MGASTLQQVLNYITAGNFTFDSSLIEFPGTKAQLKDLRPANALFHSKFEGDDANWGSGSLTGTLIGDGVVEDGVLKAVGDPAPGTDAAAIQFVGTGNFPTGNKGCVRFEFTPSYSGSRTSYLFSASLASNNIAGLVRIFQIGLLIRWDFYDSAGVSVKTVQTGNDFNPVAGTKYEIELNWDADIGEYRLFINGVNINGLQTSAGSHTLGARANMRLGDNYLVTPVASPNGTFDNLVIFDTPQHTSGASYTPFQTIPYQFSKDGPSIINNSGVTADKLDDLVQDLPAANPAGTDVLYIVNINGQDKYWDGDSLEDSDGTPAQANTLATILANKSAYDVITGATYKIKVLLISDDGSGQAEIEQVTLSYNFFNTQAQPPTCTVWGFVRDVEGLGVEGVNVTFSLKKSVAKQYREAASAIIAKDKTVQTNSQGRFELDLVRTSEYEAAGEYIVIFSKDDEVDVDNTTQPEGAVPTPIEFTVPDATDVNLTEQITAIA